MPPMAEARTGRVYDLWSRCYDGTFGRLVHTRQIRAIQELRAEPGQWVLDLGIGTGITLSEYPAGVNVVGMDLSAGMLAKAVGKAAQRSDTQHGGTHLIQADALRPPFAPHSFDHLLVTHTVSVVSEPLKLMRWCARLVKPGGWVIVLNHFQSDHRPVAWLERAANPLCTRIGWQSDLALADCLDGSGLELMYQYKLNPADVWRIVVLRPT